MRWLVLILITFILIAGYIEIPGVYYYQENNIARYSTHIIGDRIFFPRTKIPQQSETFIRPQPFSPKQTHCQKMLNTSPTQKRYIISPSQHIIENYGQHNNIDSKRIY